MTLLKVTKQVNLARYDAQQIGSVVGLPAWPARLIVAAEANLFNLFRVQRYERSRERERGVRAEHQAV